jgi:hypothetical protein
MTLARVMCLHPLGQRPEHVGKSYERKPGDPVRAPITPMIGSDGEGDEPSVHRGGQREVGHMRSINETEEQWNPPTNVQATLQRIPRR